MKERWVSLGILVFALVYLAGSISLKVGTGARPGAGMFPTAIAVALLAIAAFHAWQSFRASIGKDEGHSWTQLAPAGIAGALIVYPLLLHALDFLLSTSIVLFVLFRLLRFKTTPVSFLTAIGTTVFSYFIFAGLLGVVLPAGPMEEFILKITGLG
ncbi:MAG: tripartite tricarboxylate transporter TctB family protein [Proteobacteria bacterium]|nr:tripartite tricarboxylate transporter TctB family protein [Pseudomonadota bacterium]